MLCSDSNCGEKGYIRVKLFIPTIGVQLKLLKDTVIHILNDNDRNFTFLQKLKCEFGDRKDSHWYKDVIGLDPVFEKLYKMSFKDNWVELTLPTGVVLKVDRIYLRKGKDDYDSLTFTLDGKKTIPNGRFWLKLDTVNTLEVEIANDVAAERVVKKAKKEVEEAKRLAVIAVEEAKRLAVIAAELPIFEKAWRQQITSSVVSKNNNDSRMIEVYLAMPKTQRGEETIYELLVKILCRSYNIPSYGNACKDGTVMNKLRKKIGIL